MTKGTAHHATRRKEVPTTDANHHSRRRVGPKKTSAAPAPTMQNNVGTRWLKTHADNSSTAGIRERPVRMPRITTPRKTSATDNPSEKAYSPAMVE